MYRQAKRNGLPSGQHVPLHSHMLSPPQRLKQSQRERPSLVFPGLLISPQMPLLVIVVETLSVALGSVCLVARLRGGPLVWGII